MDLRHASGAEIRARAARGELAGPTAGLALAHVQANLVIVPKDLAFDFLLFCQRNPKPCPLLDVAEAGSPEPRHAAPGADLRTDLPGYCIYEHGRLTAEPKDLHDWWRDDLVSFLLGCSFTFEGALLEADLPLRHLELGCNVPMYRTNIACRPAGIFRGPMVVSMRPMTPPQAIQAIQICAASPWPTALLSISATPKPSAFERSSARTSATPSRSAPARSPSSGPAASRLKRSPWKSAHPSSSPTNPATCS